MPLRVIEQAVALRGSAPDTSQLIERVQAVSDDLGGVAITIADTFNRTMAGGNENGSDDVGDYLDNANWYRAQVGGLFAVVHHSGKNAAAGARGHSSLKGNVDAEVEVTKDESGIRTASVTKASDGESGDTFSFRLDQVDLGPHPHPDADVGQRWTSCVVVPLNYSPARPGRKKPKALSNDAKIALQALREVSSAHGQLIPATSSIPGGISGTKCVINKQWRDAYYSYVWLAGQAGQSGT